MKKILLFLILPFFALAQNPTNFPYGIKNTVAPTDSTPAYFTTAQVDGVHKKTPAALVAFKSDLPVSYAVIVYVNTTSPLTATIFDDENPPTTNDNAFKADVDNLYIGTDASTWVWNGSTYVTEIVTSSTSNFYIYGTTTDAGGDKNAQIYRNGSVSVINDIISSKAVSVRSFGSDTAQKGGRFSLMRPDLAEGNMFQLNASNGLDLWNYASGTWIKRFTFSSGGNFTASTYNGYTPENSANKSDSYTASSSTTYSSTKALVDGLGTKQNTLTNPITGTGTVGTISKFTGSNTLGNSFITEDSNSVTLKDNYKVWSKKTTSFSATAGAYANQFSYTPVSGNTGGAFFIQMTVGGTGISLSKQYLVNYSYNATGVNWQMLTPISSTGAYSGEDIVLDININNFVMMVRARRVSGTNVAIITLNVSTVLPSVNYVLVDESGTGTGATVTGNFAGTSLTQVSGRVLVSTNVDDNVNALQVNGSTKTTALTLTTAPTTSAGTYNPLTWNTSTGVVEKVTTIPQSLVTNLTTDLAAKAPIASPTFTGTPTAPTATAGTNTTQIATTAFVLANNVLGIGITTTSTSYTLALTDANKINLYTNGSLAVTVTVPLNSSAAFPLGTKIGGFYSGSSSLTIVATGGVTIRNNVVTSQNNIFYLVKLDTDLWALESIDKVNPRFTGTVTADVFSSTTNGLFINSGETRYSTKQIQCFEDFNFIYSKTIAGSGTNNAFSISPTLPITTGNALYNILNVSPVINQTGGANGITRSLYINPTLTSAADYRAIEVTAGKSMFQEVIANNVVRLKDYTVATLPTGVRGDTAYCTDLLAPTYMTTAVGGGTIVWKVFYDGVSWKVD